MAGTHVVPSVAAFYGPAFLADSTGAAVRGVACTITVKSSGAAAVIYNGPQRVALPSNVINSDHDGNLAFWIDPGTYTVTPASGVSAYDITVSADAAGGGGPTGAADSFAQLSDVLAGAITLPDALTIAAGTTTGLQIGTATTQKLGFFGATPVVQRSAYTQTNSTAGRTVANATSAAVTQTATVDAPAGGTGAAAGGWDTAGHRDTAIATINALRVDVAAIIADNTLLRADVATLRGLVNSLIDDAQALGFAS